MIRLQPLPHTAAGSRCAASPGIYTCIVMRLQPLLHTIAASSLCVCTYYVWLQARGVPCMATRILYHVWLQARGVWRHMVHAVAASATHDCSLFCILCAHACGCSLCYIRLLRVLQVQMNHHAEAASATKGCSYRGEGGYSVCCRPMTNSYRPGAYHAGWQLAELT